MKVVGLITEYNPFHNGHKYHLDKAKATTYSTHSVAVMSGHFMQRGEPAILDKWTRAQIAINEGVDLVIELPTIYACNSAEYFAMGSIMLLDRLNIVDKICFGSEHGRINEMSMIAKLLVEEPVKFKAMLKLYLDRGLTFPAARQRAIVDYFGSNSDLIKIIDSPNNILGIEYLKALKSINSSIIPVTIKRIKADYNSKKIEGNICSATAIRSLLSQTPLDLETLSKVVPSNSLEIYKNAIADNKGPIFVENLENILLYKIRTMSNLDLNSIHDVKEGLENRIKIASLEARNYKELIDRIKTKRYTYTRIQRILMKILLELSEKDIVEHEKKYGPQYIRVLGFSQKGRKLLKYIKAKSKLPIITNLKHYTPQNNFAKKMIDYDIKASNIYSLLFKENQYKKGNTDFTMSPFIGD